jgi:NADPH:quinone reductase-like Zn-dependent oxidoreductase
VHSAALNPIDFKVPEIYGTAFSKTSPTAETPFRIGFDAAGVVAQVGDDVKGFSVGDQVYAMAGKGEFGSLGEFFSVDAQFVALKPTTLDFDHAAGVPLASLTSFQALEHHAKLQAGERVLVLGGSSATGIYAVQHAKALGAYVIATAGTNNVDKVKSLGADEVIDYRTQKWGDVVEQHSVDVVYDCGVEPLSWEDAAQHVLKQNTGRFVTLKRGLTPSAAKFGATYSEVFTSPSGKDLAEVTKRFERGEIKLVVDSVFPLEKTADAFTRLKTGRAVGKVIVKVL